MFGLEKISVIEARLENFYRMLSGIRITTDVHRYEIRLLYAMIKYELPVNHPAKPLSHEKFLLWIAQRTNDTAYLYGKGWKKDQHGNWFKHGQQSLDDYLEGRDHTRCPACGK